MSLNKGTLDDLRIARDKPRQPGSKVWLIVAGVLVLLLLVGGIIWKLSRPGPIEVKTAVARAVATWGKTERTVLNASGYVTARRSATVSSKVTGKVIEVFIEEGMHVKEGQVLAQLDDTNVKSSLHLAEAQLKSSQSALEETRVRIKEADLNLKRISSLASNSISAQADLEHAEAEASSLRARLQQQQADVQVQQRTIATWEQQLDDTIIRAPFTGVVTSKNAQPGEMISPISAGGGFTRTGICTIVDMDSLEIEIDVNESYIQRVSPSQPVEAVLDAYPEWKIPCKVIAIIPTADRQKSTVKVRVGFDALDPRILPDMGVKVAFHENAGSQSSSAAAGGVTVPNGALQQQQGRDVVMVLQNGHATRRTVTIASTGPDEALISSGVAAGERVVINPPPDLKEGAAIKEARE